MVALRAFPWQSELVGLAVGGIGCALNRGSMMGRMAVLHSQGVLRFVSRPCGHVAVCGAL